MSQPLITIRKLVERSIIKRKKTLRLPTLSCQTVSKIRKLKQSKKEIKPSNVKSKQTLLLKILDSSSQKIKHAPNTIDQTRCYTKMQESHSPELCPRKKFSSSLSKMLLEDLDDTMEKIKDKLSTLDMRTKGISISNKILNRQVEKNQSNALNLKTIKLQRLLQQHKSKATFLNKIKSQSNISNTNLKTEPSVSHKIVVRKKLNPQKRNKKFQETNISGWNFKHQKETFQGNQYDDKFMNY